MNRQEKHELVEALKHDFSHNQASFVVNVQGLTVHQLQLLRKNVRQHGGKIKVPKNTLAKIAVRELEGMRELEPFFKQQTAVIFADKDSVAIAKVIDTFARQNERLHIIAGCVEKHIVDKKMIEFLSSLPPREQLLAKVCGTLRGPLTHHVLLLRQLIVRLLFVLKKAAEKE
jgi:large subunit ribosomal protein L10